MRCRSILKWIGLPTMSLTIVYLLCTIAHDDTASAAFDKVRSQTNKDFLLTDRVAGDAINDAVLTHRSERGGFFTLILQPPQRVTAEDVALLGPGQYPPATARWY